MPTSNNRRPLPFWFRLLALFLIILFAGDIATLYVDHQLQDGFLNSYGDKVTLLQQINGTKTIFVGGSSVLFGVSAEQYEDLGGGTAINMGLNAGTYDVYFSSILPHLSKGDTVVLALEYEAYGIDWYDMNDTFLDLAHLTEGYTSSIPLKLMPEYLFKSTINKYRRIYTLFYQKLQSFLDSDDQLYSRSLINSYGDVDQAKLKDTVCPAPLTCNFSINQETLQIIMDYVSKYEEKGARVVLVAPPSYMENAGGAVGLENSLKEYFGSRYMGSYEDWTKSDASLFYDTPYHLNPEGIQLRTAYLYYLIAESE